MMIMSINAVLLSVQLQLCHRVLRRTKLEILLYFLEEGVDNDVHSYCCYYNYCIVAYYHDNNYKCYY